MRTSFAYAFLAQFFVFKHSYAELCTYNLNIENEDVWMRVFVQSLDGEASKCFRGLTLGYVAGIEALDDSFLRHWGDKKYFLY
jgi:hypothetical protein